MVDTHERASEQTRAKPTIRIDRRWGIPLTGYACRVHDGQGPSLRLISSARSGAHVGEDGEKQEA